MGQYFLVIINSLLYIGLLFWYWKKVRCFNIGILLLCLWAATSAGAIYYYGTGMYEWKYPFTLVPFLYLFICVFIYILPVLRFRNEKIDTIITNDKIVQIIAVIISCIAILPFLENFFQLFHVMGQGAQITDVINDRYADDTYDQYYYMSKLGRSLQWYNNNCGIVSTCLLIYQFVRKRINYYLILGLSCSILSIYFAAINTGARYILVKNLLLFIVYYMIFFKHIPQVVRRKLNKILSSVAISIFVAISAISIYRFSDMVDTRIVDFSMLDWLSLYFSESYLNFNGDMWHIDNYLYGRNTAFLQRYILGITEHVVGRDFESFAAVTHIRMHVFYTMIGDIYSDFGPYFTPLVVSLVSLLFCKICHIRKKMQLSKIIFFGIIAKACFVGYEYYTYNGDEYQLIFTPFICFIIYFFENIHSKYKYIN